jgi:hypothetical protein
MILGNIDQASFNPYRKLGHFSIQNNFQPSTRYLAYFPDTTSTSTMSRASFPTGTQPPYSWLLAPKGGELSSTTLISGVGGTTSNMLAGKFMTADLAGVGGFDASMSLITSLTANLAGVGGLTGDMALTLAMSATLAGSGSIASAMALLIPLNASLAGVGGITANLKGNADLSATIYVNSGAATTQELVAAIWGAIAADYNESGTMGNKLNGAGSAGDPWTTDLTSYTTAGTAGKILQERLAQSKYIGLK